MSESQPKKIYQLYMSRSWIDARPHDNFVKEMSSRLAFVRHFVGRDAIEKCKTPQEKREAIESQIQKSDVILLLDDFGDVKEDWAREEIKIAKKLKKPIITVVAIGNYESIPEWVRQVTDRVVDEKSYDTIISNIKILVSE